LIYLQRAVAENAVVVFSKSWCPYSKKAKDLLKTHYPEVQPAIYESVQMLSLLVGGYPDVGVIVFRLDEKEDGGKAYQDYLEGKTGQRTVPNIFIRTYYCTCGCSSEMRLHFPRSTAYWR
jgi:glutaredoxin 3